jgi:membrane-associated phospholipid phosphatase
LTSHNTLDAGSSEPAGGFGKLRRDLTGEVNALDRAVSNAIASTPTPLLDKVMTWASNAATNSKLWLAVAIVLAASGRRGRRASVRGLIAVGATSITINVGAKQLFPRRRPDRMDTDKGDNVRMPTSSSFPSGHAASAFAFATAASAELPQVSLPLYGLATIVGYSRVHVGVHYPSDVLTGAVLGSAIATVVPMIITRRRRLLS